MIAKIENAILVVNSFPSYIIKLYLTGDDRKNLHFILKKWRNLEKDRNPASIKSAVNFSTRLDKVQELIELISDNEEALNMVKTIYFPDTFPLTYDV